MLNAWRFAGTVRIAGCSEPADVDGTIARHSYHDARAALLLIVGLGEWGTAHPVDLTVWDADGNTIEVWSEGHVHWRM